MRGFPAKKKYKTYSEAIQREKEIKAKILELAKRRLDYQNKNRIEFFDTAPMPGPNTKQKELIEAWLDPFYKVFTFSGSNRLGKTTIDVLLTFATMFGELPWDHANSRKGSPTKLTHLFPHTEPRKVRYIGQDWEKHIRAVVIPEFEKWWPKTRSVKKKKNNMGVDALWIDEKTGSTCEIMSNGQESELHEGWSGDLIVYDEPPKRDIRVANARGLVDRNGRELFAMTLLKEAWVAREVIQARLEDGRPDPTVFNVRGEIYDNVGYGITLQGIQQFIKTLKPEEVESRIKGIPSYMSGLVLSDWNRKTHIRKRFPTPLNWMVDILIDVHPRERQAILFLATDERNQKWVVNEIWDHGDGTWVGENIVRCVSQNAYRVNRIACDPLAKGDRNNPNTTYDKIGAVLFRHGLPLETATKDRDSGIREIKTFLKGPNGEPSLFCFDDCIRFIFEIEGWLWDKDTQKAKDAEDHQMENLYRGLLLGTRYSEPYEEDEKSSWRGSEGKSAIGGY